MLYQNTSSEQRTWPAIQHDGHTLELAPGEQADLELPEGFEDQYLQPVKAEADAAPKRPRRKAEADDNDVPGDDAGDSGPQAPVTDPSGDGATDPKEQQT
jgi:hypothetical protein